jgi:hypothetical protein
MKLAAISGVNGPFSDADIARVRRLALAARSIQAKKSKPKPGPKASGAATTARKAPSRRRAAAPAAKRAKKS